MALKRTISVFLGTDNTLTFTAWQQNSETDAELTAAIAAGTAVPKDVTGWATSLVVRSSDTDTSTATLTASGSVTGVYNATPASNTQRIVVTIADTDIPQYDGATGLTPGTYRYALKRTDDGSEQVIAYGNFKLLPATAR